MTTAGLTVRIWNEAGIPRRDADGYVDATSMCQANGKLFADYRRLAQTQEYAQALAATLGIAPEALMDIRQGGIPELQGTWIHPRLAVDLARWISPAFAVWMDGWFLESISNSHRPTPHRQLTRKSYNRPVSSWTTRERLAILSSQDRRDLALQRIARAALNRQLEYVEPRDVMQWRPFGRCPINSREMAALLQYGADVHNLGVMVPSIRCHGPGRLQVDLNACMTFLGIDPLDDDPRNAAELIDDIKDALDDPATLEAIPGMLRQVEARLPEWAIGC